MTGADERIAPDPLSETRRRYARKIMTIAGVDDAAIETAFATVPREAFLPPGPWMVSGFGPMGGIGPTPDADPGHLYNDALVAIDAGRGLNNGQPSLHARMIKALAPKPGDTLIHVGAGMGYYTAILATLTAPDGHVHGIEVVRDLAEAAERCLARAGYETATVTHGDAATLPVDIADDIYVNAGVGMVEPHWLRTLSAGGRLVMPLTIEPDIAGRLPRWGRVLVVAAQETSADTGVYAAWFEDPVAFVGCVGHRSRVQDERLAQAVRSGDIAQLRSVRLGPDPAIDADCLVPGDGWWLSAAAP